MRRRSRGAGEPLALLVQKGLLPDAHKVGRHGGVLCPERRSGSYQPGEDASHSGEEVHGCYWSVLDEQGPRHTAP